MVANSAKAMTLNNSLSGINHNVMLILLIISLILTYISAYKNGKPVCDRYILNTYLYMTTSLFLMMWMILMLAQTGIIAEWAMTSSGGTLIAAFIGILVFYFVSLIAILKLPKEHLLLKHIAHVAFISVTSVLLLYIVYVFDIKAIVTAVVLTVVMFVALSIMAWKFQSYLKSTISLPFLILFVVVVIAELIIGLIYPSSMLEKVIITIVLAFVCYFVLIKTKKVIENADACPNKETPDYVKDSIGFVISFINMFIRILELKKGR